MFNPQARWDRHLPQDPYNLNDKIWVTALFQGGKIFPKYFIWKNRLYRIKKITYNWQEKAGTDLLNLFAVETTKGIYQITFSQRNLSWKINGIL